MGNLSEGASAFVPHRTRSESSRIPSSIVALVMPRGVLVAAISSATNPYVCDRHRPLFDGEARLQF
jgi:hypothetical protein